MANNHPLKTYRLKRTPPLSRAELAAKLGVQRATVHRWESGERAIDPKLVGIVSEITGIAPQELRPDLAEMFEAAPSGAAR